jgi:hypothetical protein
VPVRARSVEAHLAPFIVQRFTPDNSQNNKLVLAPVPPESRAGEPLALTPAQARLRKMVLETVQSPHTRRNYAKALDDLFAFCASRTLFRSLLMEWCAGMEALSPSTINVRLSAVRKDGRRGPTKQPHRAGGGGQPDRRPQYPSEGNPSGELADPASRPRNCWQFPTGRL